MSNPQVSPAARQVPTLRLVGIDGYGVDASEPVTVTAPFDARVIVRERGRNAWAIYSIVLANDRDGIPNTYQTIAETLDYSVRQVIRVVHQMEESGYIYVEKGGGRSLPTTITAALQTVTLGVTSMSELPINSDTGVRDKTVTLGVTSPPTPPVVNVPPSTENKNRRELTPPKSPKANTEPYLDGFETFWQAYPRKDKRKTAAAIWSRIKPDAELLARMLQAIESQGLALREPQYRPMPTTWLNEERWTDEGSKPAANGARIVNPIDDWAERKKAELRQKAGLDNVIETTGVVR